MSIWINVTYFKVFYVRLQIPRGDEKSVRKEERSELTKKGSKLGLFLPAGAIF